MPRWWCIVSLLILIALLSGCGPKDASHDAPLRTTNAAPQQFEVRGVLREIKPDGRSAVIRHEEIPGYMDAMTMPFRVRDTNELASVKPGDELRFRLNVTDDASWIDQVRRTGTTLPLDQPKPATAATTNVPGAFGLENIPDFALTNEFGQPVSLRRFKGRALAMTFFFTRCPVPEYCPRLTKNFQGAVTKLKAMTDGPTNFHFLSVSFDPIDSPLVLRTYARGYGYDSNHWTFLTGNPAHLGELARGFGIEIKPSASGYDHNFSTAVFDATGMLQNMWPIGGDMTDQLVADMVKAARTTHSSSNPPNIK